ncbi:hypothetical protein KX505_17780 [Escherichia coli]|nr:hypothetical protein [Escherichia coli]
MSKTLLDLLNKTREDIAAKRGNNVDLTRLNEPPRKSWRLNFLRKR